MKQQSINLKISAYLFLLLISAVYSFTNTELEIRGLASTLVIVLEVILFVLFLLSERTFKFKELLKIFILLGIGSTHYLITKETVFLIMLMVSIIFSRLDYKNGFRFLFFVRLFFLILIISLSCVGILAMNKVAVFKGGSSIETIGYGLGFNHPNQLAYNIGLLLLLFICYKGEHIKQSHIAGIVLISIICYAITKTRSVLVIGAFLLLMLEVYSFSLYSNKSKRKKIFFAWKFSPLVMPVCAVVALFFPLMMSTANGRFKTILYTFNGLIGSRFTHSARVFDLYPIPLWGGIVEFNLLKSNFGYSVVDSGYLCLLYDLGIIGFVIFVGLYFFAIKNFLKRKEYYFLIVIMAISLWAINENILRSFAINFTVAFWAEFIKSDEIMLCLPKIKFRGKMK